MFGYCFPKGELTSTYIAHHPELASLSEEAALIRAREKQQRCWSHRRHLEQAGGRAGGRERCENKKGPKAKSKREGGKKEMETIFPPSSFLPPLLLYSQGWRIREIRIHNTYLLLNTLHTHTQPDSPINYDSSAGEGKRNRGEGAKATKQMPGDFHSHFFALSEIINLYPLW